MILATLNEHEVPLADFGIFTKIISLLFNLLNDRREHTQYIQL